MEHTQITRLEIRFLPSNNEAKKIVNNLKKDLNPIKVYEGNNYICFNLKSPLRVVDYQELKSSLDFYFVRQFNL